MKNHYSLFSRGNVIYYALDCRTKRQISLRTKSRDETERLLAAKNQSSDTPQLNRAMAKVYASASSPELMERTWQAVMDAYAMKSVESTRPRVESAFRGEPFRVLSRLKVNETDATAFWAVLNHQKAGNSTHHNLRRLQNFALDLRWLFEPVLPKPSWPKVKKHRTIAISLDEHAKIVGSEQNLEHRRYYDLLWETGASQSDIATMTWSRINREENTISFYRDKMDEREDEGDFHGLSKLVIGKRIAAILNECPQSGHLFPTLCKWLPQHRSTEFARRCRLAGIKRRQLKGYRYSWAQRARASGMPEREAMNHLGHKSKAIHQAYAGDAKVVTFSLEHYEDEKKRQLGAKKSKILKFPEADEATGT